MANSSPSAAPASSANRLKVMSAGAVEHMLDELAAEWTRDHGNPVDCVFGTVGVIKDKVLRGEPTDIVIVSAAVMQELEKSRLVMPGSQVPLGRTLGGIAVPDGARRPDISTPEALKQALLAARTVAYTHPNSGGTSGTFFAGLLERLGIAEAVNAKALLTRNGREVAESIASGKADIGSTFISEILPTAGAQLVGPLPPEIQNSASYVAAIAAASPHRDAAAAFVATLVAPQRRAQWAKAGFEAIS